MTPDGKPSTERPIALVGYRASGKSTLGLGLAAELGYDFLDLDLDIETRSGRSIADIFASDGEEFFRRLESEALQRAMTRTDRVIATGGGVVQRELNRELLGQRCRVVYLCLHEDELLQRLRGGPARPSLTAFDLPTEVRQVLARRDPWYRQVARHVLEVPADEEPATTLARLVQLFTSA